MIWWPLAAGAVASGAGATGLLRAQRSESELVALALERRLDAISASREPALRTPSMAGALGKMREVAEPRPALRHAPLRPPTGRTPLFHDVGFPR